MTRDDFKIVPFKNRFVVVNKEGTVIDDANGYGYKTKQNAYLAANWKFLGGKEKANKRKSDFEKWKKENPIHDQVIVDFYRYVDSYVKDIAIGYITMDDIWGWLSEDHQIEIPNFVKKEAMK